MKIYDNGVHGIVSRFRIPRHLQSTTQRTCQERKQKNKRRKPHVSSFVESMYMKNDNTQIHYIAND